MSTKAKQQARSGVSTTRVVPRQRQDAAGGQKAAGA